MIFIVFIILVVFVGSIVFMTLLLGRGAKKAVEETEKEVEDDVKERRDV